MRLAIWIEGARPKTLIASISPVVIGTAIANDHAGFSYITFLMTLLTAIFLQIGTNLANDYFDAKKGSDNSDRIGPRRMMQARLTSDLTMKRAIFTSFLIATGACIYLIVLGGPLISYLLLLAVVLGIGYTAGPYALAYLGLGDFFVFFFFGPVATGMTTYLYTQTFLWDAFVAGIGPGAISTAILATNNLRDRLSDERSSKKTLVVRFGETFGRWEYTTLLLIALSLPLVMRIVFHYNSLILLTSLLFLFAILLIKDLFFAKTSYDYIPLLPKTSLLLALYTLLFSLGLLT